MSPARPDVRLGQIFLAFLMVGGTSFGGGVVVHLRNSLVAKHRWMDDQAFVQLVAIGQSVPGLVAANMAILAGDQLRGVPGAVAALAGLCLPGAILMFFVGRVYRTEIDRPLIEAALEGVAAAAVGLLFATVMKLGHKSLGRADDLLFIVITVLCVNRLNVSVPRVLLGVGAVASVWHGVAAAIHDRPRP